MNMKHIKLFENWKEDVEKDLAFPTDRDLTNLDDESIIDRGESMGYRFRSLLRDADMSSSLDKIKDMHSSGYIRDIIEAQSQRTGKEDDDILFMNALEHGRIDVCDFLYSVGFKISNPDKVRKWIENGRLSPKTVNKWKEAGKHIVSSSMDDILYSIGSYV